MSKWEYLSDLSISKEVARADSLPISGTDYVEPDYFDLVTPSEVARFRAVGLTRSEFDQIRIAVNTRGLSMTITDSVGDEWTGIPQSASGETIQGTVLFSVELSLVIK